MIGRLLLNYTIRRLRFVSTLVPSNSAFFNADVIRAGQYKPLLRHSRDFSSNSSDDRSGNGDGSEDSPIVGVTLYNDAPPAQVKIPDDFPNVPIIAINRYPLFPGFIKKVDLRQNRLLVNLIKHKVQTRDPYVGIFVKRDNQDTSEVVNSISQLYTVGSFAKIEDIREHDLSKNGLIEMVVTAHRRIRILQQLEPESPLISNAPKLNGRRGKQRKEKKFLNVPAGEETSKQAESENTAQEKPLIFARTENVAIERIEITKEVKATMDAIIQNIREIINLSPMFGQHITLLLTPSNTVRDDPRYLCDLVATVLQSAETEELQGIMEEMDIMRRMHLALELLEKEKTIAKLRYEINKDVEKKVQEQHRKFLLNEQLKSIKRELGIEKDDKQAVIEKLDERLAELKVPEYAMKVIKEEQAKLSFLDPHSSEFSISRNYLDWLANIPWGKTSEEIKDIHLAGKILEEDHYGMKDVKDRILEFIAVGILKQKTNGKILCFHGPPGVGKTSIAKSIARALNREYYRFSVGGMSDVAEIKGHRRTYIGAMPGKLIQCLKKVQTENPLVLIDEVDKIAGANYHGDPSSALLEVLDPEQNANFVDYFLDVPVDLSQILFICTANVVEPIPGPLRDRMELIEVSGYVAEEKMEIAKRYLIPKCAEKCALDEHKLIISDEAIDSLIKSYCRESGVRNLEKHLEKIFRKAALRLVSEESIAQPITVANNNLKTYVGREKFTSERLYEVTPPGVIMGLAWTAMGGSILYIEATLSRRFAPSSHAVPATNNNIGQPQQLQPQHGNLETTGHLGDVMKESMRTAYTVAKNVLARKESSNDFLEQAYIHVHVPEGAVPKDGPSAGCTIASALLSLALGRPAVQEIAMTGEISLTGKVLPVGGIKEKIIAAKRAGVSRVLLPEENKKDFDDLPDFIKQDVTVHFVSHYDQIFDLIFPDSK